QQPDSGGQIIGIPPEITDRGLPVRVPQQPCRPPTYVPYQPRANVAATGDRREIIDPVQQIALLQCLQDAQVEGGAADAPPRKCQPDQIQSALEIGLQAFQRRLTRSIFCL